MPVLKDADALYIGGTKAKAAYLGTTQVWTGAPPPITLGPLNISSTNSTEIPGKLPINGYAAPRAGTVTSARLHGSGMATNGVYWYSGTVTSGSFGVLYFNPAQRVLAPTPTPVDGIYTFTGLSLPVNAGDYVGMWAAAGAVYSAPDANATERFTSQYNLGPAPNVGTTIGLNRAAAAWSFMFNITLE